MRKAVTCSLIAVLAVSSRRRPAHALGVDVITGVAYAPAGPPGSEGHLLDLYLPRGPRGIRCRS